MELHTGSEKSFWRKRLQDKDLEIFMGNLLRIGVVLSALIVMAGGTIYLFQHGSESQHYSHFESEPRRLRDIKYIWLTALQGHGRSIIQLGLLVLIATPIMRIVASIIGYIFERDWKFVLITLIVLSVILVSL